MENAENFKILKNTNKDIIFIPKKKLEKVDFYGKLEMYLVN